MKLSKDELLKLGWLIKANEFPVELGEAIRNHFIKEYADLVARNQKASIEHDVAHDVQWQKVKAKIEAGVAAGDPFYTLMSLPLDKNFDKAAKPYIEQMENDPRYKDFWGGSDE